MDDERPVADRIDGVPLPAQNEHLFGRDRALAELCHAYAAGRAHHAYLISGMRGSGKATLAFRFARHVLAHAVPSSAPERFDAATLPEAVRRQVANGAHPNLLHLTRPWMEKQRKFRTVITVDEVRRTHRFHGLSSGDGGWRVTIVDPADELNAEAANALLKILEEPPSRCVFLILAHNPGALLPTIRSRCRFLKLPDLSEADVTAAVRGTGQVPDDLDAIVPLAGGSVRRALQLGESGVLDAYRAFASIWNAAATGTVRDRSTAHTVADNLTRAGAGERFDLSFELMLELLEGELRRPGAEAAVLAGVAEVWKKARESRRVADEYNLDRRQVILDLFSDVFGLNQRMRMPA